MRAACAVTSGANHGRCAARASSSAPQHRAFWAAGWRHGGASSCVLGMWNVRSIKVPAGCPSGIAAATWGTSRRPVAAVALLLKPLRPRVPPWCSGAPRPAAPPTPSAPRPCALSTQQQGILKGGVVVKTKPRVERNRVLVTGGAGFVGSHLCEYLVNRGDQVRGGRGSARPAGPGLRQPRQPPHGGPDGGARGSGPWQSGPKPPRGGPHTVCHFDTYISLPSPTHPPPR